MDVEDRRLCGRAWAVQIGVLGASLQWCLVREWIGGRQGQMAVYAMCAGFLMIVIDLYITISNRNPTRKLKKLPVKTPLPKVVSESNNPSSSTKTTTLTDTTVYIALLSRILTLAELSTLTISPDTSSQHLFKVYKYIGIAIILTHLISKLLWIIIQYLNFNQLHHINEVMKG